MGPSVKSVSYIKDSIAKERNRVNKCPEKSAIWGWGVRRLIANVIFFLSIFKGGPFLRVRKKHPSFLAFDLKDKVKPDPENFIYLVKD